MARWFVDRLPQRGIPSVSLRRLLPEAQFVGCADWKVSGCTDDHRRLDPGQVFVAVREARPGTTGTSSCARRLSGARPAWWWNARALKPGDFRSSSPTPWRPIARICQALAGDPSHQLVTVGVTGSFGKTITALMVRSILEAAGDRCGLIGSLGFCDGAATRALGAGFDLCAGGMGAGPRQRLRHQSTAVRS